MQKNKKQLGVFGHYYKSLGKRFVAVFALEFVVLGGSIFISNILLPNYYKNIIDAITTGETYTYIIKIITSVLFLGLIEVLLDRTFEIIDSRVISRAFVRNGDYALRELTSHSYQFFANNFAGSLVTKLKRFVTSIDQLVGIIIRDFLYAIISVVGVIVVLFLNNKLLGITALLCFSVFFVVMVLFTKKRIPLEREKSKMESKVTGVVSDIITNILNLKLFSSQKKEMENFNILQEEDHRIRIKTWSWANSAYTVQAIISMFSKVLLIYLSVYLWSIGEITSGTIVLVISYSTILFNRLGSLGSAIRRFTDAYTTAKEFTDVLNQEIEIKDSLSPLKSSVKKGEIIFNNVLFSYKDGAPIFKNFYLKINPGEKVGIVGTSGAGKTTITKLLLRFADVTEGEILVDGTDIRNVTQDDLRSVISYVPQDPILFHRTLRENIAYGKPDASPDEIESASKEAHAHEFISGLSMGYDTLVGERGIKLSGGERQRVAIARAILKNAPILLLDEATSALDSVSEMHIKEALNRLMEGRTTIVIAHRLSTIEKMDRIIVLEKGVIVEEGSHKHLLSKKGIYFNFWSHQNGGFIE